jgi:phosphinothricin acetyltransferase
VRGGTTVRPATEDDLPALTRIYNHYVEHTVATFDVEPFTVAARQPWFEHYAGTGPHRLLVAQVDSQVDSQVAGYATSGPFRLKPAYARTVETTVYLDPTATGRGVGSLLYGELLDLVTADGMHRAYAGVALPNDASEALHRRLGFRDVGTFTEVGRKQDRWVDVRWYERALP